MSAFQLSIFLAFVSAALIVLGFVEDVQAWDPTEGILFWILGALTGIPGFYVLYKLRKAFKEEPGSAKRRMIMKDLPNF